MNIAYDKNNVYLSGQITGLDRSSVENVFFAAENYVKYLIPQCRKVFNPMREIDAQTGWADAMRICKTNLPKYGIIYMIKGWELSRGATIEHRDAKDLNMRIIYEDKRTLTMQLFNLVLDEVALLTGVSADDMCSISRRDDILKSRILAANLLISRYGFKADNLDEMFNRKRGVTRYGLRQIDSLIASDRIFKTQYEFLIK